MIDALINSSSRNKMKRLDMIDDMEVQFIKLDDWTGMKNVKKNGGVYNEYRKYKVIVFSQKN